MELDTHIFDFVEKDFSHEQKSIGSDFTFGMHIDSFGLIQI